MIQQVEMDEHIEEAMQINNHNDDIPIVTNSSNAFTTPFQFNDVQSNLVGDESIQNTKVRTWDHELGPQGMGEIKGYNFYNK